MALANPAGGGTEQREFDALMAKEAPPPGSILIPTGGTTGGVKLAIHDWESLRAGALAVRRFLGGGAVHASCVLPMHHVSGLMQLLRAFHSRGRIRFDGKSTADCCLSLVPTQLWRMMQTREGIRKLNTSRVVFVGGAAMPPPVAKKARELELPVVPVYGMTETAAMVAAVPNRDFLADPDAGAVLLGDAESSIDPDGSIRLRAGSLFKGYHGGEGIDPREGFRTGDAGWLDKEGRLHLRGRMDGRINTGGEKVDPGEVREALLRLEGVAEARVVGEPDEEWGERVVAYLRSSSSAVSWSEAEIRNALQGKLSPYKIPKSIRPLE
jgi:O-succinylbenzoic acid--CoA ligase